MKHTVVIEFGRFTVFYEGVDTLSVRRMDRMVALLVAERRRRERASLFLAGRRADSSDAQAPARTAGGSDGVRADTRGAGTRLVFTFDRDTVSCEGLQELSENELDIAMLLLVRKLKQRTRGAGAGAVAMRAAAS